MEDQEPLAGASDSGASRVPLEGGGCCEPAAAVGNHTPQPAGAGARGKGRQLTISLDAFSISSIPKLWLPPHLTPDAGIMSSGSVARVASSSVRLQWCENQAPVSDAEHLLSH